MLNRFRKEIEMLDFMVAADAVRQKTRASVEPAQDPAPKTLRRRRRGGARTEHAPRRAGTALPRPKSAESG
jgi:hypothetical protein